LTIDSNDSLTIFDRNDNPVIPECVIEGGLPNIKPADLKLMASAPMLLKAIGMIKTYAQRDEFRPEWLLGFIVELADEAIDSIDNMKPTPTPID
jgi:hypothetical protein